jgi:hypothetical protein
VTSNRPLSDVLQEILKNVQDLIRSEFRLAKAEVAQDTRAAVFSVVWLAAGAVCGLSAWAFLLWTAAFALAQVVPLWIAALLVAVAMAVAAAVLLVIGRQKIRRLHPTPDRTLASMKENLWWIRPSTR